ncbi:MAG TPA: hypothetical protein VGB43_03595, partial [Flavobacterium sp.]
MKKLYFVLIVILFADVAVGQIINIPDPNFKAKLLQPNVAYDVSEMPVIIDSNGNGEIEVSEAQLIYGLNVSNSNISDLTGISNFSALENLNCSYNLLTSITIDSAISLISFHASHNALTFIDVNIATDGYVSLSHNNLTSYAFESGNSYDTVDLSHNQISNLIFYNNDFGYLSVNHNNLSSMQITGGASAFYFADFSNNEFSLLNLIYFTFDNEATLNLGNNVIDKVQFGSSKPGNIGYTSNNTFLDLGNFNRITSCDPENQGNLYISDCPNLVY